jgi:hypothetical protein
VKITAGPYLQNVAQDAITIMWQTDEPATSMVEYEQSTRLGWSAYEGRPEPTYPYRMNSDEMRTVHAVRLTGLATEQDYFYRVSSSAGTDFAGSKGASFRTAVGDNSPFSFVTYGDSLRVHEEHRRNADLARAYRPDICVGAGDHVQDEIGRFEDGFFANAAQLLEYTPWFATMGNHDSPNEGYFKFFNYPEPHYWYSFNYGAAHFTVLNSNMDYRPGSEQWHWLEYDLKRFQNSRWKFVVFHHPPYCSNNCEIPATRVLCPLFERYGVDIVYTAHATIYERFHPLRNGHYDSENGVPYFVSGGGGYDMSLAPSELWDHLHSVSALAKSTNHFLHTSVAPDECRIRAIDTEGSLFDTLTLNKPAAPPTPQLSASPQSPYPDPLAPGTLVAGLAEGDVRWVLPQSQYALDATVTHSGEQSIRWHRQGQEPVLPAIRRVLNDDGKALEAVAGKRYTLEAWLRTADVHGGVTISLEWNGDMGFIGRVQSEALAGTREWTRLRVSTPALPPYVYCCRVVISALPGTVGTAWFDSLSISEVSGRP